MSLALRFLDASLELFLEVLPFFAAGALLAGLLQAFDDRARLGSRLGSSLGAILLGASLGCIIPVCSCGVVPVALGLLSGGVAPGPVFAFLAAAPMVNPASFVMTAGVLGSELAAGRLVGAFVLAVAVGLIGRRLAGSGPPLSSKPSQPSCCSGGSETSSGNRWSLALFHGGETFVALLRFVLLGVVLGGALDVLVRPEMVAEYFSGALSIPLAALASAPLYVCSCAEVPIALSLLRKGFDPAAVLTFLLAGPGISVFSLAMLASVLRARLLVAYVLVFFLGSVAIGFVARGLLP